MSRVWLALVVLAFAAVASATTGGPGGAGGFCLEKSGTRVLYLYDQGGESACYDGVHAVDVETGRALGEVVRCGSDHDAQRTAQLDGCVPLERRRAQDLGVGFVVRDGGAVTLTGPAFMPSAVQPQELIIKSGKARHKHAFGVCRRDKRVPGEDTTMQVSTWVAPGKRFVVVTYTYKGRCYEGGYDETSFQLLPRALAKPVTAGTALAEDAPADSVKLALVDVDLPRLFNDGGLAAYRAGKLADAEELFRQAYDLARIYKDPYPLALFNYAATLAKQGKREPAIAALRDLLTTDDDKTRAQFRNKVKRDADFKSIIESPEVQALLVDDDPAVSQDAGPRTP